LKEGDYITDQLKSKYFVSVTASANKGAKKNLGYTPNGAARVFNSSNPIADPDLGSPNELCNPSGPGEGIGGGPNALYPNCVPLRNILIIQENNDMTPDDHEYGGNITFRYDVPAYVESVGILDIDEGKNTPLIYVKLLNGTILSFDTKEAGENAYFKRLIKVADIIELRV